MVCAGAVVPTLKAAKLKFADRLTASSPVPVRLTTCGAPAVVSLMVMAPEVVPVTLGVNETVMVQVCPGVRVTPVHVSVSEYEPLAAIELTLKFTELLLVTVIFCPALVVFRT